MGVQREFKWVSVISFDLDHEAGLCASYLESHGLKVRLKNEFIARSYPSVSAATGGVQVMVPDQDVIKASVLLEKAGYIRTSSAGLPLLNSGNLLKISLVVVAIIALILFVLSALGMNKSSNYTSYTGIHSYQNIPHPHS